MLQIIPPIALICDAITPYALTLTMSSIFLPFTDVFIAIDILKLALPVRFIIYKVPFILGTIDPLHDSITMPQ